MTSPGRPAWTRRAALSLLATAAAAVAGCNIRPLYGSSGASAGSPAVRDDLAAIDVQVIADRSGQVLRGLLVQALSPDGRPDAPKYALSVALSEVRQSLGISRDDTATRGNVRVTAQSRLNAVSDGRVVWTDSRTVITSYGILDEQFATIVSERSARDRAIRQLAQEIRTSLALMFQRGVPEPATGS